MFLNNIRLASLILRIRIGIIFLAIWIAWIIGLLILATAIVEIGQSAYFHNKDIGLLTSRLVESVHFLILGSFLYLLSLDLAQNTWHRPRDIPARIQRLVGVEFRQSTLCLFGIMIVLLLFDTLTAWDVNHNIFGILILILIAFLINRFSHFL